MTLDVNHLTTNVNYEDVVTSDNNYEYEESVSKGIFWQSLISLMDKIGGDVLVKNKLSFFFHFSTACLQIMKTDLIGKFLSISPGKD